LQQYIVAAFGTLLLPRDAGRNLNGKHAGNPRAIGRKSPRQKIARVVWWQRHTFRPMIAI
jgi:hypothetical protein